MSLTKKAFNGLFLLEKDFRFVSDSICVLDERN